MLVQALTKHFNKHFDQHPHHDAVLWFDAHGDYAALLDHITAYPVWRYEGSLLALRYQLLNRQPGARVIVYLPLKADGAEVLRPFFATSYLFRESLYRFLNRQGFDFPDDAEVAHELRALLPRLAARSLGKGETFWTYNLANLERARETLLGTFDDTLLDFLAQPVESLQQLQAERLDGLFFAQLESTYGLVAPEGAPDAVARQLTAQLALVRAFVDAGQPEDFPYAARLPEPLHFDRCYAFLDRWQRDSAHKSAYTHLARRLERDYDLAGWSACLSLEDAVGLGATFATVEHALWSRLQGAMAALESEADWCAWLAAHAAQFSKRAEDFWAREGQASWWGILAQAADLLAEVRAARVELGALTTADALLRRYVQAWWRIDRDFRLLRATLERQPGAYDALRARCALSYRDILGKMNDRFSEVLGGTWPPETALPVQDTFWASVAAARDQKQRVAVFYVDALRYELGCALLAALAEENAGQQREITARLAAIPTITPIGMTAVLPEGDRRQVAYDTDWRITLPAASSAGAQSGNLKDKAARKKWLEACLSEVHFYNLSDLLDTRSDALPEAAYTIVFDTTLDAVGENAGVRAWATFGTLLQALKKGVHKLLGAGVAQIHIVADHGFLLLDEVGEHEKVNVRDVPAQAKHERYVLGTYLGSTDQLRYVVPGSEHLQAWFPRGTGCFRTPGAYNYVHGGLSLQELVVPHIVIEQRVVGKVVGVEADFPAAIHNAMPEVMLKPVAQSLLAQPRPVLLTLEREDGETLAALRKAVGVGEPVKEIVMLPFDCGLMEGDRLRWVLRDARTEEVLAQQDAISKMTIL